MRFAAAPCRGEQPEGLCDSPTPRGAACSSRTFKARRDFRCLVTLGAFLSRELPVLPLNLHFLLASAASLGASGWAPAHFVGFGPGWFPSASPTIFYLQARKLRNKRGEPPRPVALRAGHVCALLVWCIAIYCSAGSLFTTTKLTPSSVYL